MTKEEKLIVSAYTGFLMCDWDDLHKFIEETLGRPVWTHELADDKVNEEIRLRLKPRFLAICAAREESSQPRRIPVTERLPQEWWPVLGLIQFHDEKEPPAQQVLWYLGNGHWRETWRGDMIESDVTHWMPLPQPPGVTDIDVGAKTCVDCHRDCQMIGLDMPACTAYEPPEEAES